MNLYDIQPGSIVWFVKSVCVGKADYVSLIKAHITAKRDRAPYFDMECRTPDNVQLTNTSCSQDYENWHATAKEAVDSYIAQQKESLRHEAHFLKRQLEETTQPRRQRKDASLAETRNNGAKIMSKHFKLKHK